jgi:hypothetical protein
MSVLR